MKSKKVIKIIKKVRKPKPVLINVKTQMNEKKKLQQNADKYADGNLSLWLRHAGLHHIPKLNGDQI